jgi:hypothetical protein
MSPVELSVPGGEVLHNSLYEDQNPSYLVQDILAVKLQDGTLVDVSWYPQFDPDGAYTVAHYDTACETKLEEMTTRCVAAVVEEIQRVARQSSDWANGSASGPHEVERISRK